MNQPSYHRFIGDRNLRSLSDMEDYLTQKILPSYPNNGFGLYKLSLRQTHQAIGMFGLLSRPFLPAVDIGYVLLDEFSGKGYAFSAAQALVQYATTVLHLPRLLAIVLPGNVRSIHLLKKLGFTFQGTFSLPSGEILEKHAKELAAIV